MIIGLIGNKESVDCAHKYLAKASELLEIGLILSTDGTQPRYYVEKFEDIDVFLICEMSKSEYAEELVRIGVDRQKIKPVNFLMRYLDPEMKMDFLAEIIYLKYQKRYSSISQWVSIGEYTYGEPKFLYYGSGNHCKIGKFCSIGPNVEIYMGGQHHTEVFSTYPLYNFCGTMDEWNIKKLSIKDIKIGNDVWIASDVKIMPGVEIGDGAVIYPSAVVTRDIEPYMCAAGVPAKIIKSRFDRETIDFLLKIKWWDWKKKDIFNGGSFIFNSDIANLKKYMVDNNIVVQ